jgi:hypothetical protein
MLQILCAAPPTQNNGTKTLKCESEVLISERNFHKSENQSHTPLKDTPVFHSEQLLP